MSELEKIGAISDGKAIEPVTAAEATDKNTENDLKVLKIVLQDIQKAEEYIQSKRLPATWNDFDDLYRAYVISKTWPGSDVPRSNLGMPIILEAIEEVLPQIWMAYFAEKQPFLLDPIGATTPQAAKAAAKLVNWSIKVSGFKEEIRLALKSSLQYGFQVSKYGWKKHKFKIMRYERTEPKPSVPGPVGEVSVETTKSNEIKRTPEEIEVTAPTFENFHVRNVLFDPTLARQDVRKGKWVGFQIFPDIDGLDDFRNDPSYKNIPSNAEILAYIADKKAQAPDALAGSHYESFRENQALPKTNTDTQADPSKSPIQVIEYWDNGSVVTILRIMADKSYIIRNESNTEYGSIPALSNAFIDVLGSAYGFGISHLLRGEQRFQQGVINAWVDQLALTLRPSYQRIGGPNGGAQNITISPGLVRNEQTELKPLLAPDVSNTAEQALMASESRASKRVGLNATDIPTQALRTGTGVQSFQAAIAGKLQYFIEIFSELVFIPALEAFLQTCKNHLSPIQIDQILTAEEGKAFEGEHLDIYAGQFKFDVLSSTKLAARKAAAQLVPTFVQLVSAAPVNDALNVQGKKFQYDVFVDNALQLAGFDIDELIVDQTDDDKKRAAAMNPAVVDAQAKAQQQQTQQQDDLQKIEAKGEANISNSIVKTMLKSSENASALESKLGQQLGGA
jgi:hypothetical protein